MLFLVGKAIFMTFSEAGTRASRAHMNEANIESHRVQNGGQINILSPTDVESDILH